MLKQMTFEFCDCCKTYLPAEGGRVFQVDGEPMVLCADCARPENQTDIVAGRFAEKYQLAE